MAGLARLTYAADLLDDESLSAIVGQPVHATHIRIKPDHSVVVAWKKVLGEVDQVDREYGWTSVSNDPDKFAKALQRARRVDERLEIHRDTDPFLVSGSLWSDRTLAKELAEAHAALGEGYTWQVLRYNPRRRVVARVGKGERQNVVRVAATSLDHILRTAERWRNYGIPVTKAKPLGNRGTATYAPLWGVGDLLTHPHAPAAHTAGEVMAQLHAHHSSEAEALATDVEGPAEAVAQVAPWLADRVEALSARLTVRLAGQQAPAVELHGDFSPDQVLLAAENSHKIRIIDLDRAGTGPALRDVGSWVASCRVNGLPRLAEAFLTGYTAAPGPGPELDSEALSAWESYAHLSAALDSFRHRESSWPVRVEQRIQLAEEAVR